MHKLNEAFSNQGAVVSIIYYSTMNDGVPAQLSGREVWPSRNVRPTFSLNDNFLFLMPVCILASNQRESLREEKAVLTLDGC